MSQPAHDERTVIGKITSAYGIKGWVKVHSYTDPPENIFKYTPWILEEPGKKSGIQFNVDDFRLHGKGFVAHLAGINDRDTAGLYCQRLVYADIGELPELPAGEYYWQQLKGLKVYTVTSGQRDNPPLLGMVGDLLETGANDVLVVVPCEGSIDRQERLLPYVDACIIEVDLEAGSLLVDWDPEF